ncbi:expressed unknown protein [Seminavis robusta]|uniref:Fe2OG dioxygenase domain-containing protein n=1 Tax=Seminavis robusta TaxID=568900 RepID=A0A9N8E4F3_9STRA|nr:expressed unknown protein [Seminavis robusta]|eukprot:Sro607_g174690.1 n/a (585) ;mRNA; r:39273-41027
MKLYFLFQAACFTTTSISLNQLHGAQAQPLLVEEDLGCLNDDGITSDTCRPASSTTGDKPVGSLLPSHLPEPVVFTNFVENTTVSLSNGREVQVSTGTVTQINQFANSGTSSSTINSATANSESINLATEFSVLPQALSRSSVDNVLSILQDYQYLDEDPDTVDGMPTYEIFVDSPDLYQRQGNNKVRDSDPNFLPYRIQLREKLQAILQPYLTTVLTPFVQQHYPDACSNKGPSRACTPCYSLIRRYRHGDRVSHATHHDGHAIVTVVVSLSDYGRDYRGGLYVSTGFGQHEFMALKKGDAVVHQSTLLHGVKVYDKLEEPETTQRWSWILWYRDSTACADYSYEWFADCAQRGSPLCQQLHSTKVGSVPGIDAKDAYNQVLDLNFAAARGGAGGSAIKVARAYLQQLPSRLEFDQTKAAEFFQMAIQSHHPDGHYGMAHLLLAQAQLQQQQHQDNMYYQDALVVQAVAHLESAAQLGHVYAQFNLGMVHTYGYVTGHINGTLAASWFITSGLPEGYYVAAQQAKAVGDRERYAQLGQRAHALGFMAPWRKQARQHTGSGGAAGVDLNLPWPTAMDGRQPPKL